MVRINSREVVKYSIKTIDKGLIATQKTKDNMIRIKNKSEDTTNSKDRNANEYAVHRVSSASRTILNSSKGIKQKGNHSIRKTKENYIKTKEKIRNIKVKLSERKTIKSLKTSNRIIKPQIDQISIQKLSSTEKAIKLIKRTTPKVYQGIKNTTKATLSSIKSIIAGTKALITALIAGGWIMIVIVIVICLIGLLCASVFGIFFSGVKGSGSVTMETVIAECNLEFSNKLQQIQDSHPHDEYVLDGNMSSWKDILIIYSVKQSKGTNDQEVMTIDNMKKKVLKDIFWDMNLLSYEVKQETVIEQGVNALERPKEVQKKVLRVKIDSKTAEQMKLEYHFNPLQIQQYNELLSDEYAMLWDSVIYGMDSGDYVHWRQKGASWSNIKIGNTNSTISDIGCLVTSIAILIQKSGVSTESIDSFNPGTFVEKLNENGGFDSKGNLKYDSINKIIPGFRFINKVDLRGKTKEEKLSLISQYYSSGYYITAEVKGATEGNQHWVAVVGIDGNNIIMIDPGSEHTNMWSAYEYNKTSQFNYFKAN